MTTELHAMLLTPSWSIQSNLLRTCREFREESLACIPSPAPVFTDSNLATKSILLGEGPRTKVGTWDSLLVNTPESLDILITIWRTETFTNKAGAIKKRDAKDT